MAASAGGVSEERRDDGAGERGRRPGAREEAGGACVLRRLRAPAAACSGGACVRAPAAACLDRERGDIWRVRACRWRKSPKRPFVPVAVKNRY
jgi:hypothetical protein